MGHEARLILPIYIKPYVKRGKNGAAGAAAIEPRPCRGEAMRFAPVKNVEQQAALMLHDDPWTGAASADRVASLPSPRRSAWLAAAAMQAASRSSLFRALT